MSYDGYIATTDESRKKRLALEPKGFSLEGTETFSCLICHASISGENGWVDSNGEKCLSCQNAVERGVVPASVCHDRESWYSSYELINKFKITHSSISTLIREGKLKSRKIKAISGPTSFEIFLKHENEVLQNYTRNTFKRGNLH